MLKRKCLLCDNGSIVKEKSKRSHSWPLLHLGVVSSFCPSLSEMSSNIPDMTDSYESRRANWSDREVISFLEVCTKESLQMHRKNQSFSSEGWKVIEKEISKMRMSYSVKQLQNKLNLLARQYTTWDKLVRKETGIGWNPETNTFAADDEWWARKTMENKEIAKFKTVGLDMNMWNLLWLIFRGHATKGQHACFAANILAEEDDVYITEQATQNIPEVRLFSESDFMTYLNNVKETGFLDDVPCEPIGMSLDATDSSGKRKHVFNKKHSSLRSCIERTFGVWKARWRILRFMPSYPFKVQVKIILATMALHNFIRRYSNDDPAFLCFETNLDFVRKIALLHQHKNQPKVFK